MAVTEDDLYEDRAKEKPAKSKMKSRLIKGGVGCALLFAVPLVAVLALVSGVMPAASEGMVDGYQEAASAAGSSWQELLIYDMVRYENDLDEADPYASVVDFLKLNHRRYRLVESRTGAYWEEVSNYWYMNTAQILSFLELPEGSGIDAVKRKAQTLVFEEEREKAEIEWVLKYLDDLIQEQEWTEEQILWADMLQTEGILDLMFGSSFELPGYIDVSGGGYFGWPVPETYRVTDRFGWRDHPVEGGRKFHYGVDVGGPIGSPVVSIEDGVVISVDRDGGARGMNVQIRHDIDGDVWVSRYQHLSQINVSVNDDVDRGTVIGAIGNTGMSTGAHLHMELAYNGVLIDPLPLIQTSASAFSQPERREYYGKIGDAGRWPRRIRRAIA